VEGDNPALWLSGNYIDCDGGNFGVCTERLKISHFEGSADIATLSVAPLDMRTRHEELRGALMRRGARFQKMRGQCYGNYVGGAIEQETYDADGKFSVRSLLSFRSSIGLTRFTRSRAA
jgi:hypothetical protein